MLRIRNVKLFVVVLLLACVQSFAGYFIEQKYEDVPVKDSLSTLSFGGEFEFVYYLNSVHPAILLSGEWRLHKHHSADLFGVMLFSGDYVEVGANWRFFFRGLREDDFLRLGVSFISFERDDKNYFPPRVTVGYGRDIMFFKNTDFLCRLEFVASYIIGEPLFEKDGIFIREANFSVALGIGFYLF